MAHVRWTRLERYPHTPSPESNKLRITIDVVFDCIQYNNRNRLIVNHLSNDVFFIDPLVLDFHKLINSMRVFDSLYRTTHSDRVDCGIKQISIKNMFKIFRLFVFILLLIIHFKYNLQKFLNYYGENLTFLYKINIRKINTFNALVPIFQYLVSD